VDWAIRSNERTAEFWSSRPLPLEGGSARRHVKAAKVALRCALDALESTGTLAATWTSAASSADAENVLLYNLGVGAFSKLASRRLLVRRVRAAPSTQVLASGVSHHRYQVHAPELTPPARRITAEAELPRLTSTLRASDVWAAIHRGQVQPGAGTLDEPVAARITVFDGAPRAPNLAGLVKPLVDGLLAALHEFHGRDLPDIVQRAAQQVDARPEQVRAWFGRRRGSGIGAHRFVHLRGDGLQWTPADDRLVLVDLQHERVAGPARIHAQLWCPPVE